MMKLEPGFMKTQDLAEWMGLTYGSFRHNSDKRYEILGNYCVFERKKGGIDIKHVFIDTFQGDLTNNDVADYLEEIKKTSNGLSSVAGMTRKFMAYRRGYYGAKYSQVYRRLTKAGEEAFGKNRIPNSSKETPPPGPYGYREMVWAIKVNDTNCYREMKQEESDQFNEVLKVLCMKDPEKVKQEALVYDAFKSGEIEKDDYFNQMDRLQSVTFADCIAQFRDETGLQVVRCSKHELNDDPGAFGEVKQEVQEVKSQEKQSQSQSLDVKQGEYSF